MTGPEYKYIFMTRATLNDLQRDRGIIHMDKGPGGSHWKFYKNIPVITVPDEMLNYGEIAAKPTLQIAEWALNKLNEIGVPVTQDLLSEWGFLIVKG